MNERGESVRRSDDEILALGEAIAETVAILDSATHRFLSQLREFEWVRGWERTGALSLAHWLSWRVGMDLGTAREKVRVAAPAAQPLSRTANAAPCGSSHAAMRPSGGLMASIARPPVAHLRAVLRNIGHPAEGPLMDRLLGLGAIAAALALAFWAGTRVTPAPVVVERAPRPAPAMTRAEIRSAVTEAIESRATPVPLDQPPEPPPEAPAAENAGRAAASIIASGITDGVWSQSERDALRAELPALDPAHIREVLSPLFQAINAQRLELDGPPI